MLYFGKTLPYSIKRRIYAQAHKQLPAVLRVISDRTDYERRVTCGYARYGG